MIGKLKTIWARIAPTLPTPRRLEAIAQRFERLNAVGPEGRRWVLALEAENVNLREMIRAAEAQIESLTATHAGQLERADLAEIGRKVAHEKLKAVAAWVKAKPGGRHVTLEDLGNVTRAAVSGAGEGGAHVP